MKKRKQTTVDKFSNLKLDNAKAIVGGGGLEDRVNASDVD